MNELLLEILKYYGLKEVFGPEANPFIISMFREIGYNWVQDDSTAWCSASLNYFCKRLGYQRSGKLDARSWMNTGTEVMVPQMGDVVVFWRNKLDSWEGHVGLYISSDADYIYTLGGNQENSLKISPYPRSRVLGYRRLSKLNT